MSRALLYVLIIVVCFLSDDEEEVEVQQGAESIQLPCKASADLPEDTTVEWTHFDPQLVVVHVYQNKADDLQTQARFYCGRTEMNKDMSLTLKNPTDRDGGVYICTVYREGDVLRSKVLLQVTFTYFTWVFSVRYVTSVPILPIVLFFITFFFVSCDYRSRLSLIHIETYIPSL
uniref:Ig-like domain-containing protein n=1 Tax=Sphaeramia orbicularis TaxID=375764 RepID=A0A672Z1M6_9TELE